MQAFYDLDTKGLSSVYEQEMQEYYTFRCVPLIYRYPCYVQDMPPSIDSRLCVSKRCTNTGDIEVYASMYLPMSTHGLRGLGVKHVLL